MSESKESRLNEFKEVINSTSNSKEVEKSTQQKLEDEDYNNRLQDRHLRKKFSHAIFWLIALYLFVVMSLLYLCAFKDTHLDSVVLVTLLGTTTANVIGLFVIVAKYLFHNKD